MVELNTEFFEMLMSLFVNESVHGVISGYEAEM